MKRLTLFFIIGISFSIYPADDQREVQEQLVHQFLVLHTTPYALLSNTDFLQKYSEEITKFIEKDSRNVKLMESIQTESFKKEFKKLIFKYFDVLQKSDHNAHEERGSAYGEFWCAMNFEVLDSMVPREASCRKHFLESMSGGASWRNPDVMLMDILSVEKMKNMLIGIESLKKLQEKHNIPIVSGEIFYEFFEDFDAEIKKQKWRSESMDGLLKGFIKQHEISAKEFLEPKREAGSAATDLLSKCLIS